MSADVVDVEYDCGCLTGRNVVTGRAFVTHCAAHGAEPQEARAELAEDQVQAVECGNCGEPYPGLHIIENDYGNRVVICPKHTATGTTSIIHDGLIGRCDRCAVFPSEAQETTE